MDSQIRQMGSHDAAVIARVRAGDREAFRELVERYSEMVFRLAYRFAGNQDDADDIVQEAFLRAYRGLEKFEGSASFSTWLYRIATNCALDMLERRKSQPQPAVIADDDEDPPEERIVSHYPDQERTLLAREMSSHVNAAMATLTPLERTAFVLRHFEQRSIEEIAQTLEVRSGAAKHSIFRAVEKMRRALEPAMRPAR